MILASWRESVESPRFALLQLSIVILSCSAIILYPDFWLLSMMIALIPWGFRMAAGAAPFHRTGFEWVLAGFILTSAVGYWAAYDPEAASAKFTLILASVLLYFALSSQPQENLIWVSIALFALGFGVSVYFLLTHDFFESPRKLEIVNTVGRWIMQFRPSVPWTAVHPNYISGIAAISTPFIFYPLWKFRSRPSHTYLIPITAGGLAVSLFTIAMATSRGVVFAMASTAGAWIAGRMLRSSRVNLWLERDAVYPSLVLIMLVVILILLYLGPAAFGGTVMQSSHFGNGSRSEVFERSAYLVADFPFTGGGLGSYPALYSQYILNIPYYYLPNAHNMFLDVFIEQGIPGGLLFLMLYIASIWRTAHTVVASEFTDLNVFRWMAFAMILMTFVHGMVDDYFYNGKGTILLMVPVGVAALTMKYKVPPEKINRSKSGFALLSGGVVLLGMIALNFDQIRSAWFANMGAVQMARAELAGFPANQWRGLEIVPLLEPTKSPLLASLEADPANRTANHRLGLIAMSRKDFSSAVAYLEAAHAQSPGHRGITKALGYCYIWLAEYDVAQRVLESIPEAGDELDTYAWWWQTQGRYDLSEQVSTMLTHMKGEVSQP